MYWVILWIIVGLVSAKPYIWDHPRAYPGGWKLSNVDFASVLIWVLLWPLLWITRIILRSQ